MGRVQQQIRVRGITRILRDPSTAYESVVHGARTTPKSTTKASYTTRPETVYVACKKENHPVNTCGKFQAMSRDERWAFLKKHGYCTNCLKAGHMASKCRAPPACRKCYKAHHTLLHIEIRPSEELTTEMVSSAICVPRTQRGENFC